MIKLIKHSDGSGAGGRHGLTLTCWAVYVEKKLVSKDFNRIQRK